MSYPNNDLRHRTLLNKLLELKDFENWHKPIDVEIEYPYNYYGDRGFIDVLAITKDTTSIYEIKPDLENLGEAIRQLRKAENILKKLNYSGSHEETHYTRFIDTRIDMILVTELNEENYLILEASFKILDNLPHRFWVSFIYKDKITWAPAYLLSKKLKEGNTILEGQAEILNFARSRDTRIPLEDFTSDNNGGF